MKLKKEKPAGTGRELAGKTRNQAGYSTNGELCQYHRAEVLAEGDYFIIPNAVLHDDQLTAAEKLCWVALAAHQRGEDKSWPSITRLAYLTCLSKRTVIRILQGLESKGYLKRKRRHGTTSLYQLFYIPGLNHSQSNAIMAPLLPKVKPEHNHSQSGATVSLGRCQNGTGVVPLCHPEKEAVNKRQEKEKNKGDASASLVGESQKLQNFSTKGNGQDRHLWKLAVDILDDLNTWGDKRWPENEATLEPIIKRLREGYSYHELRAATLHCVGLWKGTPYERNLRPSIIFGRNLDRYIAEGAAIVELSQFVEQAQKEVSRLEEEGLALKRSQAPEEQLQELREQYRAARKRLETAVDEFYRHLEYQYPPVFTVSGEKLEDDSRWR